jgi:hypothetical protein
MTKINNISSGSLILFDPSELTKKPSEKLPTQYEQVIFWPKGAGVPVGGIFMDGHWYQIQINKKNVKYSQYDGEVDFWMEIPQMRIKK